MFQSKLSLRSIDIDKALMFIARNLKSSSRTLEMEKVPRRKLNQIEHVLSGMI